MTRNPGQPPPPPPQPAIPPRQVPPVQRPYAAAPYGQYPLPAYRPPDYSILSALLLAGAMVAICLMGAAFGQLQLVDGGHVMVVLTVLLSLLTLGWVMFWPGDSLDGLVRFGNPLWYFGAAAFSLVTIAVAMGTVGVFVELLGLPHVRYTDALTESGYGTPTAIVVICVLPAVFEELAFRGVVMSAFRRYMGPWGAILLSATAFTVVHLSPLGVGYLFLIGTALGFLRHKTGSLYPCMLLHFCHNLLVILSELYLDW